MDELEKENKPRELKPVFMGAEREKIKAIKGGTKVLEKNEDLLKPRQGIKWGEKITDLKLVEGKPKFVKQE